MKVTPTPAFLKAMRKLPPDRRKAVARGLAEFVTDPKIPSLDFRVLSGMPG